MTPELRKIVFLDFDGVLNNTESLKKGTDIEPEAVARVAKIVTQTGAKIVISSTWRLFYSLTELRQRLTKAGLPSDIVIGATPEIHDGIRGDEIALWLKQHRAVGKFVILDDDADMGRLIDRLVRTSFSVGLTDENAQQAIDILGSNHAP